MAGATYDREADVLYVSLADGQSAWQTFVDDCRILDYSAEGSVLGVEFICASEGIDLRDLPFARSIEELIGESGHHFPVFV